jgi:hypothetical protein
MALSVRSSPPLILEAGGRPPTVIEWEQLREFITHSYKTKQHTARKIREELGNHGFAVTYIIISMTSIIKATNIEVEKNYYAPD